MDVINLLIVFGVGGLTAWALTVVFIGRDNLTGQVFFGEKDALMFTLTMVARRHFTRDSKGREESSFQTRHCVLDIGNLSNDACPDIKGTLSFYKNSSKSLRQVVLRMPFRGGLGAKEAIVAIDEMFGSADFDSVDVQLQTCVDESQICVPAYTKVPLIRQEPSEGQSWWSKKRGARASS